MTELTPCPACRRHVLAHETRCPFCDRALAFAVPMRPVAPARLGRAATMAFGAAALVAGCSKEAAPPAPSTDEHLGTSSAVPVVVAAPDAAAAPAVTSDASASVDAAASADASAALAASAPIDGGRPLATGAAKDASAPKWIARPPPNLAKPYGAPPAAGLRRIV
jgi:hypothetical protein